MFTKNKSLNIHWTYSNMLNMLNTAKHAETCCCPLTPLFKKWGQGAAACFFPVLQRSEHVSPCSVFFNVLNIEHVQIFFFHVQKTISCSLMFTHVQHVQHVLSLFRACSQGLNMLNMQLTAKMANIFLIMFHFGISCWGMFSVFRTEIKWKGKVSHEDKTSVLSWYFLTRLLNSKFRKQMDTLKYSVYQIYGCIHLFACLESWKIQRYHNSIEKTSNECKKGQQLTG